MSVRSGSVDGKDNTICIAGVCQDHRDHGSKYTLIIKQIPPHYFKTQLRMDRDTFDVLLNLLHPSLLRQNTSLRDCIPPEKVLALGLYCLAHGNSYSTIGANLKALSTILVDIINMIL